MTRLVVLGLALLSLSSLQTQESGARKTVGNADLFPRYVSRLPAADRIVIAAMGGRKGDDGIEYIDARLASLELTSEKATELWRLWRALKQGNGAGCFAPGYTLDFYAGRKLLLSTHVCFHCCNATMAGGSIRSICGDGIAIERFRTFVTTTLPIPEATRAK